MGRVLAFPQRQPQTESVPAVLPPPERSIALELAWDAVRRLRARLVVAWSVAGVLAAALIALGVLVLARA